MCLVCRYMAMQGKTVSGLHSRPIPLPKLRAPATTPSTDEEGR